MTRAKKNAYDDYYNALSTFKMNREMKEIISEHLRLKGGTWQGFIDELIRDYMSKNNIFFNKPKVTKKIVYKIEESSTTASTDTSVQDTNVVL